RVVGAEEQDLAVGREARASHPRRPLEDQLRVGVAERRRPLEEPILARRTRIRWRVVRAAAALSGCGLTAAGRARVPAAGIPAAARTATVAAAVPATRAAVRARRRRLELEVVEAV